MYDLSFHIQYLELERFRPWNDAETYPQFLVSWIWGDRQFRKNSTSRFWFHRALLRGSLATLLTVMLFEPDLTEAPRTQHYSASVADAGLCDAAQVGHGTAVGAGADEPLQGYLVVAFFAPGMPSASVQCRILQKQCFCTVHYL